MQLVFYAVIADIKITAQLSDKQVLDDYLNRKNIIKTDCFIIFFL